jgi:hypothetical protein
VKKVVCEEEGNLFVKKVVCEEEDEEESDEEGEESIEFH